MDTFYKNVPAVEQEEHLPSKCNSCCILDREGYISLGNILATYEAPINEEHAWALCYLSAKCLETHSLSSSTSKNWHTRRLKHFPTDCPAELIKICLQDGHVALEVDTIDGNDTSHVEDCGENCDEKRLTKTKLISKIALIIYQSLDFGMKDDEERSLSCELESILDKMASYEDDNEDDDEHAYYENQNHCTVEHDIIMTCLSHFQNSGLSCGESADSYYKQICKILAFETVEFSKFVRVAERASKRLKYLCCGSDNLPRKTLSDIFAINVKEDLREIAKVWMKVVRELRRGVSLKRLDDSDVHHHKYEKTPYELLMDDIKSQKYKLRKVPEMGERPKVKGKLNLHDIIMEYIRSCPKLRKVSERVLKPAALHKTDPYEELMKSIRQVHHLRPVNVQGSI